MAGDPYWYNVTLLMHMDDAALTDVKGNTITLAGNAARSATNGREAFGGYSAYFDGAGDYATTTYAMAKFDWWTEDFTLEAWAYADAFTTWQYSDGTYLHAKMIGNTTVAAATSFWSFGPLASGAVQFRYRTGSATYAVTSTQAVTSGAWNHIALVKTSAGVNIFVNGVGLASPVAVSGAPTSSIATPLTIGAMNSTYLTGYIDDLRITKGVARYFANFTPPSSAFPNRLPQLHGTVIDQYGNFAARPIIAFSRNRAGVTYATTSDAMTGEFTLPVSEVSEHVAIALPVEGDPHWSNVVLAMHMDDEGLTDLKGHAVTLTGNAARSAAQSKFGGYSAYFDGTGDRLSILSSLDWSMGNTFTIEFWMYTLNMPASGNNCRIVMIGTNAQYTAFAIGFGATGAISFGVPASGTKGIGSSAGVVTINSWDHYAICVNNSTGYLYKNGTSIATPTVITTQTSGAVPLYIGYDTVGTVDHNFRGYVDDLRITKGVARYTADFTPPAAAFPHAVTGGTENALIFDNLIPV